MPKLIIFDFDGTIADTLDLSFTIINELSTKYHFNSIPSKEEYIKLFNYGLPSIIKQLRISPFKIPFLIKEAQKIVEERINQIKLFPGIASVIQELAQKYSLGIISSNVKELITKILSRGKMQDSFQLIIGTNRKKNSKSKRIDLFMKHFLVSPQDTILVGDTAWDIKEANKRNIQSIAVTWGFHSPEILKRENPTAIATSPSQILKIVENMV